MKDKNIYTFLTACIAMVWLVNGLFCKVLNFVPRHEQIIAKILGNGYSRSLSIFIGVLEIGMAIWVLSRISPRLCAVIQITAVAAMNILEFTFVPDLLYWGKMNSVFALIFIFLIYFQEFHLLKRTVISI